MSKRFFQNRTAVFTTLVVLIVALIGILAPIVAPNDPYETNIINKFAEYSMKYPLGTDQLGRCVLSRMIYGIRPTLGLAALTEIDWNDWNRCYFGYYGRIFSRNCRRSNYAYCRCYAFFS